MSTLTELDHELAKRHGSFASYSTEVDPVLVETYGDSPTDEVDRLLDIFAKPDSHVLDLGCGAGFTLCRLAPHVAAIWGFDQDADLLAAAQLADATDAVQRGTGSAGIRALHALQHDGKGSKSAEPPQSLSLPSCGGTLCACCSGGEAA